MGFEILSDKEYFSNTAISNSDLCNFDRSPWHYLNGIQKTESMMFGNVAHTYLLQPDKTLHFVDVQKRTAKAFWNVADIEGVENVALVKEQQQLHDMQEVLYNTDFMCEDPSIKNIGDLILSSKVELAAFWSELLVDRRCKIDIFKEYELCNVIYDYKTTSDISKFSRSVLSYNYYRQAAKYIDAGEDITGKTTLFVFIVQEKKEPYGVKLFTLDHDYIEKGRKEDEQSLKRYIEWDLRGRPVELYDPGIQLLECPEWAKGGMDELSF